MAKQVKSEIKNYFELPMLEKLLFWAVVGVGLFGILYTIVYIYLLYSSPAPKVMVAGSFSDIVSLLALQGVLINAILLHRLLLKVK